MEKYLSLFAFDSIILDKLIGDKMMLDYKFDMYNRGGCKMVRPPKALPG